MTDTLAFGLTLLVTHTAAFWIGVFVACCAAVINMKHDPHWWLSRIERMQP